MGTGKAYPETRDVRTIAVLLATQGMIRLGEIPDPLNGKKIFDAEGARFFIDLLRVLQDKTKGNSSPDEAAIVAGIVENMQNVFTQKTEEKK